MKSLIIQPSHVRGLGNILDNEDNIQGLHCRVEAQDSLVEFNDLELKTYHMGTGNQLNIRFILDTLSILPSGTVHIDVRVTDNENNPVSGVDLYVYEEEELLSQLESDEYGYGVVDGSLGFNFTSEDVGKHTLKCVIPRQDIYYGSKNELVINVLQETTLTLTVDPETIDTLSDTITLYGTLLNEQDDPVVGEIITFYDNTTLLGWGITDDRGVATLVANIEDIQDLGLVPTVSINWVAASDDPNNHTEDGSLYVYAAINGTAITGLPLTILVNNSVVFEGATDSTGHADILGTTLNENALVTVMTKHTSLYNATTNQYTLEDTPLKIYSLSLSGTNLTDPNCLGEVSCVPVNTNITCRVNVRSEDNVPIPGLTVQFYKDSTLLGRSSTNENGDASWTLNSGSISDEYLLKAIVIDQPGYIGTHREFNTILVGNEGSSCEDYIV